MAGSTKRPPHRLKPTEIRTALMLVADGRTLRQIADTIGCATGTINRALLDMPEEYEEAKERRRDRIRSERWDRAFDRTDKWSAKFLDDLALEQLPETRQARTKQVEVTGRDGDLIQVERRTTLAEVAEFLNALGYSGGAPGGGGGARALVPGPAEVRPAGHLPKDE